MTTPQGEGPSDEDAAVGGEDAPEAVVVLVTLPPERAAT